MIYSVKVLAPVAAAFLIAACGGTANSEETEAGSAAISGEYKADQKHRYITFHYLHQGYSRPFLRWRDWDATLNWNAEDATASSVSVTIDASSIDSGVDEFDGHLRGDKFFDVENHPVITFESTSLTTTDENTGTMTGDLTIKGITKPVTLNVTMNRASFSDRNKLYKIGFSAKGTVKRSDFGVDLYAPVVSDEVDLVIETEFEMSAE